MKPLLLVFSLVLLAGLAQADSLYMRQVGYYHANFFASDVAVKDSYAYVAADESLHILRVADPTHISQVGSVFLVGARGVAVAGDFAYVADCYDSLLFVVSVADPAHPVVVGSCPTPSGAYKVAIRGHYAYVVTASGFGIFSVADPTRPFQVGWLPGGHEYNLDVRGDYAYVADIDSGLRIISLVDPSYPAEVGSFYCSPQGVAVSAGLAYIGCNDSSFHVISVSDPENPVEVGRLDSVVWAWGTQSVGVTRGFAFVTNWTSGYQAVGLWVVSVVAPTRPVMTAHYLLGSCWSTALDGSYFYVSTDFALYVLQFYQLGDIDIDNDSLDVTADTLRLRRWTTAPRDSLECARGEFVLANTTAAYNPDTIDGPSVSLVDSMSVTGSLSGPGGTVDSIVVPNLPSLIAQGQTMVCTLAAYVPVGFRDGDYTGSIYISGKDTAGLWVYESCYVCLQKLGDIDVDSDSLDVRADTIRLRPVELAYPLGTRARAKTGDSPSEQLRQTRCGTVPVFATTSDCWGGAFVLVNTSSSYNPDTADGPSRSRVDSLSFTCSLAGPGGPLDSVLILNLPESLEQGQSATCTLAVCMPDSLPAGDYVGSIVITGCDSLGCPLAETVHVLLRKEAGVLGDLDVDDDSLDLVRDTMKVRAQPGYVPSGTARFMVVNTTSSYNPDTADGPSQSILRKVKAEAKVEGQNGAMNSVYVLNLPESLAAGQAVECTLALVLRAGATPDDYSGWVFVTATDTLGFSVQDSFAVVVSSAGPHQSLDSFRVVPIPFKPNQNPEHDAIHFQGLTAGARVIVYDASGQTVWSATESGDGHLAWKAEVASGIYVYLVVSADGKSSKVGKLSVIR